MQFGSDAVGGDEQFGRMQFDNQHWDVQQMVRGYPESWLRWHQSEDIEDYVVRLKVPGLRRWRARWVPVLNEWRAALMIETTWKEPVMQEPLEQNHLARMVKGIGEQLSALTAQVTALTNLAATGQLGASASGVAAAAGGGAGPAAAAGGGDGKGRGKGNGGAASGGGKRKSKGGAAQAQQLLEELVEEPGEDAGQVEGHQVVWIDPPKPDKPRSWPPIGRTQAYTEMKRQIAAELSAMFAIKDRAVVDDGESAEEEPELKRPRSKEENDRQLFDNIWSLFQGRIKQLTTFGDAKTLREATGEKNQSLRPGYFIKKIDSADKLAISLKDANRMGQCRIMRLNWGVFIEVWKVFRIQDFESFKRNKEREFRQAMTNARTASLVWSHMCLEAAREENKLLMEDEMEQPTITLDEFIDKRDLILTYPSLKLLPESDVAIQFLMPVLKHGLNLAFMKGHYVSDLDRKALPVLKLFSRPDLKEKWFDAEQGDAQEVAKTLYQVTAGQQLPGEDLEMAVKKVQTDSELEIFELYRDNRQVGIPLIKRAQRMVEKLQTQAKRDQHLRRGDAIATEVANLITTQTLVAMKSMKQPTGEVKADDDCDAPHIEDGHGGAGDKADIFANILSMMVDYQETLDVLEIDDVADPLVVLLVPSSESLHGAFCAKYNAFHGAALAQCQAGDREGGIRMLKASFKFLAFRWDQAMKPLLKIFAASHHNKPESSKTILPGDDCAFFFNTLAKVDLAFDQLFSLLPTVVAATNLPKTPDEASARFTAAKPLFMQLDVTGKHARSRLSELMTVHSVLTKFLDSMSDAEFACLDNWLKNPTKMQLAVVQAMLDGSKGLLDELVSLVQSKGCGIRFEDLEADACAYPTLTERVQTGAKHKTESDLADQAHTIALVVNQSECRTIKNSQHESAFKVASCMALVHAATSVSWMSAKQVVLPYVTKAWDSFVICKDADASVYGLGSPMDRALKSMFAGAVTQAFLLRLLSDLELAVGKIPKGYEKASVSDNTDDVKSTILNGPGAKLESVLDDQVSAYKFFRDGPLKKAGSLAGGEFVGVYAKLSDNFEKAQKFILTFQAMVLVYRKLPKATKDNIAPTVRTHKTPQP